MTIVEFLEMLDTTEPCFEFQGVYYQICTVNGKYLAGFSDTEEFDQWFDTKSSLLEWKLQGTPLKSAIPYLHFQ